MLASALRGDVCHRALENLQQRLLHALARDVAGDGRVLALAGDFVDLVDIDDAVLGQLHVEICRLQQAQQDILDVVADIAGLGEGRRVGDGERHLQHAGERLGKEGLARAGRPDHKDVALLELHILPTAEVDPLVVVVDRHGQGNFCLLLSDDVLIQHRLDLLRGGQLLRCLVALSLLVIAVVQNGHAQLDALVADAHTRPLNHTVDLILPLAAERAPKGFLFVSHQRYLL